MLTVLRYEANPDSLTRCYLATGRSCIVHLIRKYDPGCAHLPEMYPEGLYAPFVRSGVKTTRYKLQPNLEPDLDSLEYCLRTHKAERPIVVLVHYFGYWMPSHMPAALAHAHGGLLLEDCAHCLPNPEGRGCGDIALYSMNKFFPIVSGALMLSCNPEVDLSPPDGLPVLQQEAVDAYRQHLLENRILANMPTPTTYVERAALTGVQARSVAAYNAYYKIISEDMEPRRPNEMMRHDPEAERQRRVERAVFTADILVPRDMQYRSPALPQWAFPIRCDDVLSMQKKLVESGTIPSQLSDKWTVPDWFKSHLLVPLACGYNFHEGRRPNSGPQA